MPPEDSEKGGLLAIARATYGIRDDAPTHVDFSWLPGRLLWLRNRAITFVMYRFSQTREWARRDAGIRSDTQSKESRVKGVINMRPLINRRKLLSGFSGLAVLSTTMVARATNNSSSSSAVFRHGVASGDPDHGSVVLWTRVTVPTSRVTVQWELARDEQFRFLLKRGSTTTDSQRDHTVKVLVDDLPPGETLYYRFVCEEEHSETGRTRTLPSGSLAALGIAIASCSNYPFGYFNAYEAIARDPAIDFVLHLGDYIYEYGPDGYGGRSGAFLGRPHMPAHETITLADYRLRHAQYKSDEQSRAMHAAHPLIPIWDDHESANNPWMGGAENHQSDEGDWVDRRSASLRAYFEWMPIRDPSASSGRAAYWRHFEFGDLASLVTLESRHTGRSEQIEYSDFLDSILDAEQAKRFMEDTVGAAGRRMLSPEMEGHLRASLEESVASMRTWRLLGNQIPMARTHAPRLDHPYFEKLVTDSQNPVGNTINSLRRLGELDLPIYLDPWDGYPKAREELYKLARKAGTTDLLVLTGDSHSFWQNSLYDDTGRPMGVELGTAGITSPGDFQAFDVEGAELMDGLLAERNREVEWTDGRHNGFVRLRLEKEVATVDYISVTNISSRSYEVETLRTVQISREGKSLTYL